MSSPFGDRDSPHNVSPGTRTPRSHSPLATRAANGHTESPVTLPSPLRAEFRVENGDAVRPQTANSVSVNASQTSGLPATPPLTAFPFYAAPGASGEDPTTDGLHQKRISQVEREESADVTTDLPEAGLDGTLTRKRTREAGVGSATPPGRRSVQFARSATDGIIPSHSRQQSVEQADGEETLAKDNDRSSSSLMAKLKALAAPIAMPGHGRSLSGWTIGELGRAGPPSGPQSPENDRFGEHTPGLTREDSEADADGEESGAEGQPEASMSRRQRRKLRRAQDSGNSTAPTTPKYSKMPSFLRDSPSITPTSSNRPVVPTRRATMTEIPEHSSARLGGVSEDEGRERYGKVWRRGTALMHSARGLSSTAVRRQHDHQQAAEPSEIRRPSHLRRLTGFGGTTAADGSLSAWRHRGERTTSVSAQKWRQIKAGLKMLGQKRRIENAVDHAKSAELVAELLSGAPAALLLASMFQRDEHGHRRIPVLLEQLKVKVVDAHPISDRGGDRHVLFRVELEYGNGLTRMKWQIQRSLRDFINLHAKYKLKSSTDRIQFKSDDARSKLPRFPKSAFPYLKSIRGLADDDFDDDEPPPPLETDAEASGPDRPRRPPRRRTSNVFTRRKTSLSGPVSLAEQAPPTPGGAPKQETYEQRQRRRLEQYMRGMIAAFMFRPDSNRLCRFLELSALGMRLACEGGYKGKEGYMMIQSGKGIDFRKKWTPGLIAKRHTPKWFLIRHSYILCVDDPSEMSVYDVFLVDPDFTIGARKKKLGDSNKPTDGVDLAKMAKNSAAHPKHHLLRLSNSERKMKFLAKNERQLGQFIESLQIMSTGTLWSKPHRFDSFAPARSNAWAQWLVDGRDYMWNVSRALEAARDSIYIHDWWLSPELYLRRPPAISQKWRLDRILKRKAEQGVKIFVIMYRNINSAIPIDSEYSKFSLLDLHPYVYVQRSPNQLRQNTFFWAHHEKVCVVDNMVAFCGGIDLCFGRWDTPGHTVIDDKLTGFEFTDQPRDSDHCQLWPGKDYSNPRVQDFYDLHKPYEEMYDRSRVPRMPWHDIGMQVVGQPARDLGRHFTQRWNYILRQKKSSRALPHLLPPPDFGPGEVEALGLDGTCEIQILRSACEWSLGTPGKTEHSIMNAYVAAIEASQSFVYIENQFFISSCVVEGSKVLNRIGDALVQRIIRADAEDEDWRAVIIIPLVPGFQNTVDSAEGSSVRLIMQCQYSSICRGETSIFGRLRARGIEPRDYIEFYSLRSWGRIGPSKALATEQLYIHAKCMVVDDQVAIIGSANINERSMLGNRDSEIAAIVRDREMFWSRMGGKRVRVGRFPHTLRVRLMREHLGIDVDDIQERERVNEDYERVLQKMADGGSQDGHGSDSDADIPIDRQKAKNFLKARHSVQDEYLARAAENLHSFNHDYNVEEDDPHSKDKKGRTTDPRIIGNEEHRLDVEGKGFDQMQEAERLHEHVGRDSIVDKKGREVLIHNIATEGHGSLAVPKKGSTSRKRSTSAPQPYADSKEESNNALPPSHLPRMDTHLLGLTLLSQLPALPATDDTDIGGPSLQRSFSQSSMTIVAPLIKNMHRPILTEQCVIDPLSPSFSRDIWHEIALNNTRIYRTVFRCMPDDEVRDWATYHEYAAFTERFAQSMGIGGKSKTREAPDRPSGRTGPPGTGTTVTDKITQVAQNAGLEKLPSKDGKGGKSHSHGDVMQWADDQEKRAQASSRASQSADLHDAAAGNEKGAIPEEEPNGLAVEPSQAALDSNFSTVSGAHTRERTVTISEPHPHPGPSTTHNTPMANGGNAAKLDTKGSTKRRRRGTTKSSRFRADTEEMLERDDAEKLLTLVQGHLVVFPYDWLEKEEKDGGWLYAVDQIAPLEIYT